MSQMGQQNQQSPKTLEPWNPRPLDSLRFWTRQKQSFLPDPPAWELLVYGACTFLCAFLWPWPPNHTQSTILLSRLLFLWISQAILKILSHSKKLYERALYKITVTMSRPPLFSFWHKNWSLEAIHPIGIRKIGTFTGKWGDMQRFFASSAHEI